MNTHMPKPRGKNHRAILTLANSPHPCRRCSVHTHRRTHARTHTHIAVGWRHFACPCRLQKSSPDQHYCIRSLHQITAAAQKQEYILHYHSITEFMPTTNTYILHAAYLQYYMHIKGLEFGMPYIFGTYASDQYLLLNKTCCWLLTGRPEMEMLFEYKRLQSDWP